MPERVLELPHVPPRRPAHLWSPPELFQTDPATPPERPLLLPQQPFAPSELLLELVERTLP